MGINSIKQFAKYKGKLIMIRNNDKNETYLIEGMMKNDENAYRVAINTYQNSMYHLAASIVGNDHANDVVQNAWMQIIKALPKFERRSSMKTWILAIVYNAAINVLRKERRTFVFSDLSKNPQADFMDMTFDGNKKAGSDTRNKKWEFDTPDALLESVELRALLVSKIGSLRPMQQAVVRLREVEGTSIRDMSDILGISETNVRVVLHRARLQIRNVIDDYQQGKNLRVVNDESFVMTAYG